MTWHLSIRNIAGIRQGQARIEPGINAVRASNWQGKSSFLASVKTAFGTATPLTEGQSSGEVALRTDDAEITVELKRTNGTVSSTGRPYLDDEYDRVCAELFAFLDENNAIRQAVRTGGNLEPLLTKPLAFENIDERIADLRTEREQVERELEEADQAADRLPRIQQRVTSLEANLEALRNERAALDTETVGSSAVREQLSELRAERDQVATEIERLETTMEHIREMLSEKRDELQSLTVPSDSDLEDELERLHADLRDIERDEELLQSVYEANKRVLAEGRAELLTEVSHDMLGDSLNCWLCGNNATRDDIETRLAGIEDRIGELRTKAARSRERLEELEEKRDDINAARRRKADLTDRIAELESRRAETEESLETARERQDTLESTIEELTEEVDSTQSRITDLESEIKYTEAELTDVREELEAAESLAERRELLQEEYDSLTGEISDLRNRKEDVKRRMREAFSATLDDLLERFDTGFESARLTSAFDLVVARDGREAQLDALSEGERELLGFVVALAGHDAFDTGDRVPVMLLDGLGGLASKNLQLLVNYLSDTVDYLVLTVYPEYEGFQGHELSPTDWQIVSHNPDMGAVS